MKVPRMDIQWGKGSLFNHWLGDNWIVTCKRMKLKHHLTLYTKINSELIKDLNIGSETLKLLEENLGGKLFDIDLSDFFKLMPKVKPTKVKLICGTNSN